MLDDLLAGAFEQAKEAGFTSPIVFTAKDGSTITGEAVGVPASGSPADGFEASTTIRERFRRLTVQLADATELPKSGMTTVWEGATWNVTGISPLAPGGTPTTMRRVTIGR